MKNGSIVRIEKLAVCQLVQRVELSMAPNHRFRTVHVSEPV